MSNFNKLKQYASNIKKPDSTMTMASEVSHAPKEVREYEDRQTKINIDEVNQENNQAKTKPLFNPKKKSKRIMNYRLDEVLAEKITKFCEGQNITVTEFHVKVIEDFLKGV